MCWILKQLKHDSGILSKDVPKGSWDSNQGGPVMHSGSSTVPGVRRVCSSQCGCLPADLHGVLSSMHSTDAESCCVPGSVRVDQCKTAGMLGETDMI